jgi:hypothetical protein
MEQYKKTPFFMMDDNSENAMVCLVADDIVTGQKTVVMQMGIPFDQADSIVSIEHLIAILQLKAREKESPEEFRDIQVIHHNDDSTWVAHYCHAGGMLLKFYLVSPDEMSAIVAEMESRMAANQSESNAEVGTEEWFNSLFPTK